MNTYGALPNASLLHLYGFSEEGNPHDVVGGGTHSIGMSVTPHICPDTDTGLNCQRGV